MTLKYVVEALVFASPKPMMTKEILAALKSAGEGSEDAEVKAFAASKEAEVIAALHEIEDELMNSGRPYRLQERVNGWALVSESSCAHWVRQLYPEAKPTRLTGPQLETLAIIAYRQPVTRADCEAVRGVAVDGVMQVLLDRGLVKIVGRAEVPGRPLLYSTSEYFLQHFGLKTTDELPNAGELKRVVLPTAKTEEPAAAAAAAAPVDPAEQKQADEGVPAEASASNEVEAPAAPAAEQETSSEQAPEDAEAPAEESAEPESQPEPEAAPEPEAEPEPEPAPEPEGPPAEEPAEPELAEEPTPREGDDDQKQT